MVGGKQNLVVRHSVFRAMGKQMPRAMSPALSASENSDRHQNQSSPAPQSPLTSLTRQSRAPKRRAIRQLLRQRLVVRRSAPRGRGYKQICQHRGRHCGHSRRLAGKSTIVELRIHKFSRRVSGKRPACAIRAMRPRSKAQHKHPGVRIAKPWHRLTPILVIFISPPLLKSNPLPILHQPRTSRAGDDLRIKLNEPRWKSHAVWRGHSCPREFHSSKIGMGGKRVESL